MTAKSGFAILPATLLLSSCSGVRSAWGSLQAIPTGTLIVTILLAAFLQLLVLAVIILLYRRTLQRLESRLRALDSELKVRDSEIRESEHDRDELRSVLLSRDTLVSSLSQSPRYLSDAEWVRLEALLDEVCDGFCARLPRSYPGMTQAELRTAALLRLGFSGQQMAAMMGISPTSVTKGKQRLKARLDLPASADLEKALTAF